MIDHLAEDIFILNGSTEGPREIWQNGRTYFRFMDRLYLPTTTDKLNPDQISVINRYRERELRNDARFELNLSVKKRTGAALIRCGVKHLLEIGCGNFPLSRTVAGFLSYTGVEIDRVAIAGNTADGVHCVSTEEFLSSKLGSYDGFVSLFVFQFNIDPKLLKRMYDVTSSDLVGIINLQAASNALRQQRLEQLKDAGFEVRTSMDDHPKLRRNEFFLISKRADDQRLEKFKSFLSAQRDTAGNP